MRDKKLEARIIADLKTRCVDGLQTSEIAKKYGISVQTAYRFMLNLYEEGFKCNSGASLCRNSGDEHTAIQHTHWFFS